MKVRLNEDYYVWCCDWCDTENRVLWGKIMDMSYCGACHRPMNNIPAEGDGTVITESTIAAGLC